ncbi:MAG: hypothetical protein ACEPOZ_07150 [Marinifilaceae bacterium]
MRTETLNNLILLGQLHKHNTARLLDYSAELINQTNHLILKIINEKEIQVRYNFYDNIQIELIPTTAIYDFLENLLTREESNKIDVKTGVTIEVCDWKDQLKSNLIKIQSEKNYDQYLKHLRLESERFKIEYFDGIVVLRDKNKELLTSVFELKNALQQAV